MSAAGAQAQHEAEARRAAGYERLDDTPTFLKWAGGKRWLAPLLRGVVRETKGRYFEPFLGGGSVFLSAGPRRATLSDVNEELLTAYRVVKRDPEGLIRSLRAKKFTETNYYCERDRQPRTELQRAARLVFLNRTCWNGLYRVNREGEFNVPCGAFVYPPDYVQADRIRAAARRLRHARLELRDFARTIQDAGSGDLVYADPPYTVAHENNGFVKYNEDIFRWADQERLAASLREAVRRGADVILSNAKHASVLPLYDFLRVAPVRRFTAIAADSGRRRRVGEYLFVTDRIAAALPCLP